eukprot:g10931.t2
MERAEAEMEAISAFGPSPFSFSCSASFARWARFEVDEGECKSAINQWSQVKPFGGCQPPKQRSLHASIVVGDCLYIFGGYDGSSRVNDFYKFSFKASKWSYTDKIYIFAGYDGNNRVNDFWQYDTEHESWQMVDAALGNPPTPRHSHSGVESIVPVKGSVPKARYRTSAVAYKNRMLVVGGHDGAKHLRPARIQRPAATSLPRAPFGADRPDASATRAALRHKELPEMSPILLLSLAATTSAAWVGRWGEAEEMLSLIIQFPKNLQPKQIQIPEEGVGISADGSKMVMGGIEINMFKSDGGGNFQTGWNDAQLSSATSQKLRDLAMSSDGNIIVSAGDTSDVDAQTWTQGSFRSTDFGATWNQISTTPMTGIAMSANGNVIAAVTPTSNAGVLVSTDGGTTWATNTPSESTTLTAIAMSSDGSIMAATGYGNNGGIWTSTDTGSTWTHALSDAGVWESVSMSADGSSCHGGMKHDEAIEPLRARPTAFRAVRIRCTTIELVCLT